MNKTTNTKPRRQWFKPAILAVFAGLTLSGCHYYADDPYYGPSHSGPVYSGSGYYGPSYYGPGYYRSGYYRPIIVTGPRYSRGRYEVRRGIRRGVRYRGRSDVRRGVRAGGRATTRGRAVRRSAGRKPPYRRPVERYKSPNW